ncbi:hypothetical protein [Kitasatospora sp. NBC_01300]|uniref:hypothetical protein n=1 Tax=Kitasatospora sp. NBC_01300 TaxID=2903574 RepID=UPI00352EBFE7|nr:hypothetical protein OG556_07535 [Kitasatospora sp. NBC_01300]
MSGHNPASPQGHRELASLQRKKPYWQPYWWRLMFRSDTTPEWVAMDRGPLSPISNHALKTMSIEAWADALLEEALHELEDLRGDLRVECYEEPVLTDGTPPVYSCQGRLPGR